MAASIGLAMSGLLACTAANPAYRPEDLGRRDGGDGIDAGAPSSFKLGDAATGPDAGAAACGKARPPLTDLVAVDSLAIDGHGNIYFSNDDGTHAWIGKLAPDATRADKHWLAIPLGLPTRGMAVDDARGLIYFTAGTSAPELQAADLAGNPPQPRTVAGGLIDPNDVAVAFDGRIYVSDQGDGQVYSFAPDGKRTKVTGQAIGVRNNGTGPAGIAFAPGGSLVIGYKGTGPLIRLFLGGDGIETRRDTFGPTNDWINGLAYDERGGLYLAIYDQMNLRDVVRIASDAAPPVPVATGGHFSAMAFGRGALYCTDLYITDPTPGMQVRRVPTDYAGLSLP